MTALRTRGRLAPFVETRRAFGGRVFVIRYDPDDPDWRARVLGRYDPLSAEAFVLRSVPLTAAERAAFSAWADAELARIQGNAP